MISNKDIEQQVFDILDECDELEFENKGEDAINKIIEVWNLINYPKMKEPMGYLLLERFFDLCIKCKKFELANKWISMIFISALDRVDDGDREFIAGRLAYEQGDLGIAKELFTIANIKSEGELFKGKEKKLYRDLIK
ncbi:UNVERIFIED_ORG: hypothetical protein B2H98_06425 [Clostridium botulinum]|uniref:Uncharacterized protein n=1 Tax=Clostridium botulinum TaxID=1491 RepID=A0A6M0SUY2_CLOBO|nr:hypothetical protein [Clostridium botulinum]